MNHDECTVNLILASGRAQGIESAVHITDPYNFNIPFNIYSVISFQSAYYVILCNYE